MAKAEETKLNIYQRLHAVMGEVDYVQKERKGGMNYSIVSHDAVTGKVRPILHKHGIVYHPVDMTRTQDGNRTQIDFSVAFVNIDDPADRVTVPTCGYGIDSQDKGVGKAISYGVKYALLKVLGLETGDDPDNDQNAQHVPPQRATPGRDNGNGELSPKQALAAVVGEWSGVKREDIRSAVLDTARAAGVSVNGKPMTDAQAKKVLAWVDEHRKNAGMDWQTAIGQEAQ